MKTTDVAKKMKKSSFNLPHGEKETPQLRDRFKNYYKKHAGYGDKADKGHMLRQNNFYSFNKPEYDSPKRKGKASLNPVQKSKDNMVMEGRNEQEKN